MIFFSQIPLSLQDWHSINNSLQFAVVCSYLSLIKALLKMEIHAG